jgi:hypothetical protein
MQLRRTDHSVEIIVAFDAAAASLLTSPSCNGPTCVLLDLSSKGTFNVERGADFPRVLRGTKSESRDYAQDARPLEAKGANND